MTQNWNCPCSPDLLLPSGGTGAQRGQDLGVEDERAAHRSSVYFAMSASLTGPYWASSEWSSMSVSRRFRQAPLDLGPDSLAMED